MKLLKRLRCAFGAHDYQPAGKSSLGTPQRVCAVFYARQLLIRSEFASGRKPKW